MRHVPGLEATLLAAATAVMLIASVFVWSDLGRAEEIAAPRCTCPEAGHEAGKPKFAEFDTRRLILDESDEIAALESIQVGLSRMDDGTAFVWRRANGRLSGIVRPTASFKNAGGAVCRHVVVLLTTGFKTRTLEGVACRTPERRWVLEG